MNNTNSEAPREKLNSLLEAYKQGNFNDVREGAKKLSVAYPKSHVVWNLLGATSAATGDLSTALAAFQRVCNLTPNSADAYYNLGNAQRDGGDIKTAIASYAKALLIDSSHFRSHCNLGNILRDQGKLEDAVASFEKALTFKSNYYQAYYGLAATLHKLGNLNGMLENLAKVNLNTDDKLNHQRFSRLPYKIMSAIIDEQLGQNIKSYSPLEKIEFPVIIERKVELELIEFIYKMSTQNLDDTADARYGAGRCSVGFDLFDRSGPIIQKMAIELLQQIECGLGIKILHHESFFNILGAGGGSRPHDHILKQDRHFDLFKYKFSLVYYLDVGCQENCTEPGILKIFDPDIDILPANGMGIIIPASRKHAAIYNGSRDRVMIGCNFYGI